jgi:peptidyl-prolyl cis-trans isomerase A (cyclophilin A)
MLRSLSAVLLAATLVACTGTAPAPEPKPEPDAVVETPVDKVEEPVAATEGPSADDFTIPPKTKQVQCGKADVPVEVDPNSLEATPLPEGAHPALIDPSQANETAPETFKVKFETTEGDFVVEAHRAWSPVGVDRFYNLVKIGWFEQARFFRAVEGFMVQFGINGAPQANQAWQNARIKDDPVVVGNKRGFVTFAKCGAPNCRSTQLFLNTRDNSALDRQGFAAIGVIVEGMDVVDSLYTCYGEGAPQGTGPRQDLVQRIGNAYLNAGWPNLSGIKKATIVEGGAH